MFDSISVIAGLVVGLVLGWFGHRLAIHRERQNRAHQGQIAKAARKAQFLRFMGQWRGEAEKYDMGTLWIDFRAKLHNFRAESAAIDDDFSRERWPDFALLCMALFDLEEKVGRKTYPEIKDAISDALGKVIHFVESEPNAQD